MSGNRQIYMILKFISFVFFVPFLCALVLLQEVSVQFEPKVPNLVCSKIIKMNSILNMNFHLFTFC